MRPARSKADLALAQRDDPPAHAYRAVAVHVQIKRARPSGLLALPHQHAGRPLTAARQQPAAQVGASRARARILVHAAARLLCAQGARGGHDLQAAVYAYNHAQWYVDKVLAQAAAYADTTSPVPAAYADTTSPVPAPNQAAAAAIVFARTRIGTPYEWGGTGTPGHGYDCSGLTQAAYAAARIPIPRVAQDQYNAGPRLPAGAPLLPGDLLFFAEEAERWSGVIRFAQVTLD